MKHNEMAQNSEESESKVVVQKIPLELLVPSEYNSRRCRPPDRVQELTQSLHSYGQREALQVYPGIGDNLGKYMILSGVTRLMVAKTLGWTTLNAIVDLDLDPNDPLKLISLSRQYNDVARETDMDHAALLNELEDKGYTRAR